VNASISRVNASISSGKAFIPRVSAFIPPLNAFIPPRIAFIPPQIAFIPRVKAFIRPGKRFIPRGNPFPARGPCYEARVDPSPVSAEALFERFFWPLYPEDTRTSLAATRTLDANPARNPALYAHLDDAARVFEQMAPALFEGDDPRLDRTDASVHRLSPLLTEARREAWGARGAPGTADSELFNVVIHAAAYVGACVVANHEGRWLVRRPLWESLVGLDSAAGQGELAVFHWVLKSLADPVPGLPHATLADRYRTHVETPRLDPATLPILAETRTLPRLAKVRYAALHQHLRAHLPELRDLGEDFPSAERLDEMRLTSLDFHLVGGGRMLVMFGPGQGGAHLFWLTRSGFEKSGFWPADAFPAPVLSVHGDKLRLMTQQDGKTLLHEMLWWGP